MRIVSIPPGKADTIDILMITRGCHLVNKPTKKTLLPGEYMKHANPNLPGMIRLKNGE